MTKHIDPTAGMKRRFKPAYTNHEKALSAAIAQYLSADDHVPMQVITTVSQESNGDLRVVSRVQQEHQPVIVAEDVITNPEDMNKPGDVIQMKKDLSSDSK